MHRWKMIFNTDRCPTAVIEIMILLLLIASLVTSTFQTNRGSKPSHSRNRECCHKSNHSKYLTWTCHRICNTNQNEMNHLWPTLTLSNLHRRSHWIRVSLNSSRWDFQDWKTSRTYFPNLRRSKAETMVLTWLMTTIPASTRLTLRCANKKIRTLCLCNKPPPRSHRILQWWPPPWKISKTTSTELKTGGRHRPKIDSVTFKSN